MSALKNFLADNYIIFMIVSVFLLFAIIGFIAGERKKNKKGVQTASATDQPINSSNTPVSPVSTPSVAIAPETPVMMQEEVTPQVSPVVAGPVINEPVVVANEQMPAAAFQVEPTPVTPEVQLTPKEEAEVAPTLVIDEPTSNETQQLAPTPEMPEVQLTPKEEVEVAPTLVIDEPVVAGVPASPVVSEPQVSLEPQVVNEVPVTPNLEVPVVPEVEPQIELPNIELPIVDSTIENNNSVLEPVVTEAPVTPNVAEEAPIENQTSIFENQINQ